MILTPSDLARALRGGSSGPLGVRPGERTDDATDYERDSADTEWLDIAFHALRDPVKRVDFQSLSGQRMVTRGVFLWSPDAADRLFALVKGSDSYGLSEWTSTGLVARFRGFLGTRSGLDDVGNAVTASAQGLLVWLAIVDGVYGDRLGALLGGATPSGLINGDAVRGRLGDSLLDDVRWPLSFLSRVMARPVAALLADADVDSGLVELVGLGLLEAVVGTGSDTLYELSEQGASLAAESLASVSSLALGMAENRADGKVGHESMLFVRSPERIVFYAVGAGRGIAATPPWDAVDKVLSSAFGLPLAMARR